MRILFLALLAFALACNNDDPTPSPVDEAPPSAGSNTDDSNDNNRNTNDTNTNDTNTNTNTNTNDNNENADDSNDNDSTTPVGSITLSPLDTLLTPQTVPFGSTGTIRMEAPVTATNATVTAVEATSPVLSGTPLPMRDDGVAPDTASGDGVYTAEFALSGGESPGVYEVEILASGIDTESNAVEERRTLTLIVAEGYLVTASVAGGLSSIAGDSNSVVYPSGIHAIALPFDLDFYGRTLISGAEGALSDDGHLTFNGRTNYVNAGTATSALSVSDGAPGIAVHISSTFVATIYSLVEGDAPNRTWTIEWVGTYLGGGSGAFQLRFEEGTSGFTIHYGQMAPIGNPAWAIVAVDSDTAFNEVYTTANRPNLESVNQTRWSFSTP